MLISIASDTRQFLAPISTRPAVLKTDSEGTVEAGGVSKSRVRMENIGYIDSCDFHDAKISKFLNSEFASISGGYSTSRISGLLVLTDEECGSIFKVKLTKI